MRFCWCDNKQLFFGYKGELFAKTKYQWLSHSLHNTLIYGHSQGLKEGIFARLQNCFLTHKLLKHSLILFLFSFSKNQETFSVLYQIYESRKKNQKKVNNEVTSLNLWGQKRGCFHLAWKFKEMAKCQKEGSLLLRSPWYELRTIEAVSLYEPP